MKLKDALKKTGVSAIVYAESGMGKTHLLGTLPGKTLIIAAEADGVKCLARSARVDDIDVWHLPKCEKDLNAFFDKLIKDDLPYDNVALDSATELDKYLMLEKTDPDKNDGVPQQRTYLIAQFCMRRYLRILRDLAAVRGKNVIITALEQELTLSRSGDQEVSKAYPAISTKKFPPEACGIVDIVAHLEKMSDGRRFLRLEPTEHVVAKDRIFSRKGCFADGALLLTGKTGNENNENGEEK